jgi:uncharacterized protein (DUF362 family)
LEVRAVGLTELERRTASVGIAGKEIVLELPRLLLDETDFFITAPVPKIHAMTRVSLGFKNQWGCIPDVKRLRHHCDFNRKVLAVNRLVRTRLAVFDGSFFLDVTGPLAGDPVRMDLCVAGEVGLATRVCCEIMEVDPSGVPHLELAMAEKMMPRTLEGCDLSGDIGKLQRPFRLKRSLSDWAAYAVFHSRLATELMYCSALAGPFHKVLYAIKGQPVDFKPEW